MDEDERAGIVYSECQRQRRHLLNRGVNPDWIDDILQDTAIILLNKVEAGKDVSSHPNFPALVRLIAQRQAKDRWNRAANRFEVASGDAAPAGPALADAGNAEIHTLMEKLPRRQREVVRLHLIEDHPLREVAALIGVKPSTAKTHLQRARRTLRVQLSDPEGNRT